MRLPSHSLRHAILFAIGTSVAQHAGAQTPATPRSKAVAVRRDGPVLLDGRLDEGAWLKAPVSNQFTQSYPNVGRVDTTTSVRVLYDEDALYVGIRMLDPRPDSIAAQLARRDAIGIYSDWVHLIIDSYYDRRTAFRFTVNPVGVQKDVYTSNDNNEDTNWDAVWDVATRVDSAGWVAEYRIPLSQLRFGDVPAGSERVWGFQVMRDVARRSERTSFNPWTPDGSGFASRMGDLTGLVGIPQPQRLEILPYVSAKVTRQPGDADNPFYRKTDAKPNVGGDVRYGLPGGLTLTGTINPDFGQVEVDPAVVNLSAFETFFPEKRPFFLEGSDVFNFGNVIRNNDYGGQTFFYTRRIGRGPIRFPSGAGINYVDMPDVTPIAAAAKLTGKKGPWTIGLLDALTPEVKADVAATSAGRDSSTAVNPLTNFFAGRARRDFRGGGTVVGSMFTLANRRQSPLFTNLLSTSAGFGGIDFEHRWDQGRYVLSGFGVQSRVNGSPGVIAGLQRNSSHYFQRPDADHLTFDATRTSLGGHAEEIAIQKNGDSFGSLAIKNVSPGFEINDVGFHGRVDYRAISPFWGLQRNQRDKYTLNKFAGVWWNGAWNGDDDMLFSGFGSSASATFVNRQNANIGFGGQVRTMDDRLLRGGPVAERPAGWYAQASFGTDQRRRFSLNPSVNYQANIDDPSWSWNGNLFIETRPSTQVRVTFGPSYSREFSTSQYTRSVTDALMTETFGSRYVFADLNQTVFSLDTRIEWTLTSKLSVQSYLQPFVAVGRYDSFKEFQTPREYDFAVYGRDKGSITANTTAGGGVESYTVDPDGAGPAATFDIGNPNFNVHSLRGNAVLRWEYRPGSALFVVWQQERNGVEEVFQFDTRRDVGAIFRERPSNIFLIKGVYWLAK
ncbi:MAG TPA: DUF5916 domain-containing protein [Gemmatimonadaceae bacterium]|nr:DUF5916 domain-containing protein [Gemmatimonadaceae bacterium]